MIRHALLLLMLALLPISTSFAENQVNEIYETWLPPEKLIPILEPMLGPEDRITSFHNKLIVHAPPERQEKILDLLEDIDKPLRNILVSVRYGTQQTAQERSNQTSVRYEDAQKGIRIGGEPSLDDNIVIYKGSSRDDRIQVRSVSRQRFSTNNEKTLSEIRLLEGSQGFLQMGTEVAQQQWVLLYPNGFGSTTEYRMTGSGVYVVAQIVKDKVRIELFTSQSKPTGNNRIEKTEAQSVLLVEPDVWTPFASASIQGARQASGKVLDTRNLQQQNHQGLELKVTILK